MEKTSPKHAFVTGATGFLGQHLCRHLNAQGWQVTALYRSLPEKTLDGVNYVQGNILSMASLSEAIPQETTVIFHTAADTGTWSKYNASQTLTNVTGTGHIIQCARQLPDVRLVHVSSVATYGIEHNELITINEQTPASGINSFVNYVRSKSQAEQLIKQQQDLDWVIVHPSHIIGPEDKHNWIRLFKMIINNSLPSVPRGAGSFADVRDVSQGCIAAANKGRSQQHYILGGHNLSFAEFILTTADSFGVNIDFKQKPQWLLKIVAKLQASASYLSNKPPDLTPESLQLISHRYTTDCGKAEAELGYEITPLKVSLNDIKKDLQQRALL